MKLHFRGSMVSLGKKLPDEITLCSRDGTDR